jgi:hypothetical protein
MTDFFRLIIAITHSPLCHYYAAIAIRHYADAGLLPFFSLIFDISMPRHCDY